MDNQKINHRTITGKKKSLATRNALLAATMRVIGSPVIRFPNIEDVIKEADVSRGTFYKHFSSLDQAMEEVGLFLANEWIEAIAPIHAPISSPVLRASLGTRLLLTSAYEHKDWGRFMLRSKLTHPNSRLMKTIQKDVLEGMTSGIFVVTDVAFTTQLVMGINWAACEKMTSSQKLKDLQETISIAILTILLALGLSKTAARKAVEFSDEFMRNNEIVWPNLFWDDRQKDADPRPSR